MTNCEANYVKACTKSTQTQPALSCKKASDNKTGAVINYTNLPDSLGEAINFGLMACSEKVGQKRVYRRVL